MSDTLNGTTSGVYATYLSEQEARELLVTAGKRLQAEGLVARTWGNISCRLDKERFLITPSGRTYDQVTPEDMVIINIADLSWSGAIKPSSEKGLHAEIYKLSDVVGTTDATGKRNAANSAGHGDSAGNHDSGGDKGTASEPIGAIIHTHQQNASAVAAAGKDVPLTGKAAELMGNIVPCAPYGLPGTKKLSTGTGKVLAQTGSKAALLANHGAVCYGKDMEEAFAIAQELETVCAEFVAEHAKATDHAKAAQGTHTTKAAGVVKTPQAGKSAPDAMITLREGNTLRMIQPDQHMATIPIDTPLEALPTIDSPQPLLTPALANLTRHLAVYQARADISAIISTQSPAIQAVSETSDTVKPLLDDMAQLVGTSIKRAPEATLDKDLKLLIKRLKKRNAVLVKNNGALCVAESLDDAHAVCQVTEKACQAWTQSAILGGGHKISPIESWLMRRVYLTKYSKLHAKNR